MSPKNTSIRLIVTVIKNKLNLKTNLSFIIVDLCPNSFKPFYEALKPSTLLQINL